MRLLFFLITSGLICSSLVNAQLCTGSLGDPVVKIDFGSGTGRGAALGSAITTYTYSASGMPNDGYYTIANSTSGMLSSWWTTTDHTGNTNGYMMVVNASAGAGVFYTKTVTGLCPGTNYEFAAWAMNLFNVTTNPNPNLTFKISTTAGVTLGTYTTGNILASSSAVKWNQYGFFFTTGTESDVVITIINNAPGAVPGNDLILDDITFRPCGPTVAILMDGSSLTRELCEGDTSTFGFTSIISSGYSNPAYQWQLSIDSGVTWTDIAGATGITYTRNAITGTGAFWYRLAVAQVANIGSVSCRVASNVVKMVVHTNPDPKAASNNPACSGDTLVLSAAGGSSGYAWTGPNGFTSSSQNPVLNAITTVNNGDYYVKLTTALGCFSYDTVNITVNASPIADAGNDAIICEGISVALHGSGGSSFSWLPAASLSDAYVPSPLASPTDTTNYILTVSNGQCKASDTVTVFVYKKPTANAGPDQQIYEGASAQLAGVAGGTSVAWYWTPGYAISNTTILNPVVNPKTDTTYTLYVTSNHGCATDTDAVFIRVYRKITIPNAFSPNNDGINDTWTINNLITYPEAQLAVFNRYGQRVYESKGYATEWNGKYNGKSLPTGTYYYTIDLKNGLNKFSGWVVILQ